MTPLKPLSLNPPTYATRSASNRGVARFGAEGDAPPADKPAEQAHQCKGGGCCFFGPVFKLIGKIAKCLKGLFTDPIGTIKSFFTKAKPAEEAPPEAGK